MKSALTLCVTVAFFLLLSGCAGGNGPTTPGGGDPPIAFAAVTKDAPYFPGQPLTFDASASRDNDQNGQSIVKYEWDWDSDGTYDDETTETSFVHVFHVTGTHSVQLRVTDNEGSRDILDQPLDVEISPIGDLPTASAKVTTPPPFFRKHVITFDASESEDNDELGEEIVTYQWDWESDGIYDAMSDDPVLDHIFPDPGEFLITLKVTDDEGDSAELFTPIEMIVENTIDPIIRVQVEPTRQLTGQPVFFMDTGSSDPDGGEIVKWEWDIDNDGTFDKEGDNVNEWWFEPGTHYVNCRITDDDTETSMLADPLVVDVIDPMEKGWVLTWGGPNNDVGEAIDVDNDGNILVAGYFYGQVDFDPGYETSYGIGDSWVHCFVSKFAPDGDFLWSAQWTGNQDDSISGVEADNDGNVYISGSFKYPADFDPAPGQQLTYSNGKIDCFLLKLDPDGNFEWVATWGSDEKDKTTGMTVDNDGNIALIGSFQETADFDPSPDYYNLTADGTSDVFIVKYSSDCQLIWAVKFEGNDGHVVSYEIDSDQHGNLYTTGYYNGTVHFGNPLDFYTSENHSSWLLRYSSNGEYKWAKTWGGTDDVYSFAVAVRAINEIYVAGTFTMHAEFDPGPGEVWRQSWEHSNDVYLSKFDQYGDFQWVNKWGREGYELLKGITIDSSDIVYVTGAYGSPMDFDPGPHVDYHGYMGMRDTFVSAYFPTGTHKWTATWGSEDAERGNDVAVSSDGSIFVTGHYHGATDFYPGSGVFLSSYTGSSDIFLSKLLPSGGWD